MTAFAITVLCIMILIILLYLVTALYSFGVKLPKWIKITTGVFFIVYSAFAIIGFLLMKGISVNSASMVLVIINLILGIYMLLKTSMPKWFKILVGVIACILMVLNIVGCFGVPSTLGSVTMDMGLNGL